MGKKFLLAAFCLLCFLINVHSQLERKTWLVGGNASFNTDKNSLTSRNAINISLKPDIGYFIWNKLPIGLKINYDFQSYNINGANSHSLNIGPFIRYYFLNDGMLINFFAEGNYGYGSYKIAGVYPISNGKLSQYSFLAGPALYFNSSICLEFTIGYYDNRDITQKITDKGIQIGLGFHVHLKK